MDQHKIGKLIEKYRKQKKLTQKELANLLGVSNTAVSKWETGNNLPDISMLEPLSEVLDVDILDLLKSQTSTHEDTSKKFIKHKKHKLYKTLIIILVFISTICITNTITYNKVSNRITTYKKKETEVYSISTPENSDIYLKGYIIFNDKNNLIMLEQLIINENKTIDIEKIKEINVKIKVGEDILLINKITPKKDKNININDLFNNFKIHSSELNLKDYKRDFKDLNLVIDIFYKNNESYSIKSKININNNFTSNVNI